MSSVSPKVSVILPTYNRAELIVFAIESVLSQTQSDFELIIVDNGSTDNTEDVIKKIEDKRIRYLVNPNPSGGPARPRNFGVAASKGKILSFIDSDDAWAKDKLETELAVLKQDDVVAVCGLACEWDGEKKGKIINKELLYPLHTTFEGIFLKNYFVASGLTVRKGIFNELGGFYDQNENYHFCEDWDLWLRTSLAGKIVPIDKELIYIRVNNERGSDVVDFYERGFATANYIAEQKKVEPQLFRKALVNLVISGVHANFLNSPEFSRKIILRHWNQNLYNVKERMYFFIIFFFSFIPLRIIRSGLISGLRMVYRRVKYS